MSQIEDIHEGMGEMQGNQSAGIEATICHVTQTGTTAQTPVVLPHETVRKMVITKGRVQGYGKRTYYNTAEVDKLLKNGQILPSTARRIKKAKSQTDHRDRIKEFRGYLKVLKTSKEWKSVITDPQPESEEAFEGMFSRENIDIKNGIPEDNTERLDLARRILLAYNADPNATPEGIKRNGIADKERRPVDEVKIITPVAQAVYGSTTAPDKEKVRNLIEMMAEERVLVYTNFTFTTSGSCDVNNVHCLILAIKLYNSIRDCRPDFDHSPSRPFFFNLVYLYMHYYLSFAEMIALGRSECSDLFTDEWAASAPNFECGRAACIEMCKLATSEIPAEVIGATDPKYKALEIGEIYINSLWRCELINVVMDHLGYCAPAGRSWDNEDIRARIMDQVCKIGISGDYMWLSQAEIQRQAYTQALQ